MAQYRANPRIEVKALRIVKSEKQKKTGETTLTLEDGTTFSPDEGMMSRMTPAEGDYVVWQADGYVYLNPAAVFESKYLPVVVSNDDVQRQVKEQTDKAGRQVLQHMTDQLAKTADKAGIDITEELSAITAKVAR